HTATMSAGEFTTSVCAASGRRAWDYSPGSPSLCREEVVVRGVVHPRLGALSASASRGHTADSRGALDAAHFAERAFAADGFRAEQQPGDVAGRRRVGALLHRADDL